MQLSHQVTGLDIVPDAEFIKIKKKRKTLEGSIWYQKNPHMKPATTPFQL